MLLCYLAKGPTAVIVSNFTELTLKLVEAGVGLVFCLYLTLLGLLTAKKLTSFLGSL